MSTDQEEWREVPGWEGFYAVSDHGRVKSLPRTVAGYGGRVHVRKERVLKQTPWASGHLRVNFYREGRITPMAVHRLVLLTFVGPPPSSKYQCCHFDGDPAHNRLSNLRWDTPANNALDRHRHATAWSVLITHCPQGHEYTAENTRLSGPYGTRRNCRACGRETCRRRRAAKKLEVAA